ncbi:ABC transporter permease [Neobacillus vireti]|uniref:Nitrous oxide reductase maturation transmembrane protein NosY n=1 Tax=Neobacillus vireti LMG 21834 TaxID=1131730 RepID=A0AB94ISZ4_9BACI|nr:ABC transporter permease subunit [Neobacillus vireti]ETI70078.1 Nitrous oxide reductase maturation transmembrane protein NosY [Neobacillus vireti LMG 21834]KLT18306.1 ABC transporter permease [Neobacillus vireti]
MRNLWLSEWKTMTRQRSYFLFLILWGLVFSLLFLLERNNAGLSSFTNVTGTIVNILLYLLPLFMLIIGSFSITNEMESGQWQLLCTYPVSIPAYLFGKFAGLITAQAAVFTLSFAISMAIGMLSGIQLSLSWLLGIYLFSLLLIYVFLILGLFIGTVAKTRWKALMTSVAIWFFLIMIWPTALIAILGLVPYPLIDPLMKLAMVLNPAEFLRIFLIIQWDSGAVFGGSYDGVVHLFQSGAGWSILFGYMIAYVFVLFSLAILFLRRRRFL